MRNLDRASHGKILDGYRLSTIEILYWMPDHPSVLQSFIWQRYDLPPDYPELHRFLEFWRRNIEATLHSVRISAAEPYRPARMRNARAVYRLH